MKSENILMIAVLCWNGIVLLLYGVDKRRAVLGKRRISEKTLLLCAWLLGGIGAFLGMLLFRHKTRKGAFRIMLPVTFILTAGVLLYLLAQIARPLA